MSQVARMDFAVPRTESPFQHQGLDPTQFTPKHVGYSYKTLWVQQNVEKWSFYPDCCSALAFLELKPYPERDHTILGRFSHPGGTRKVGRFRFQLMCTKESNEETFVCSCLMQKRFLPCCSFHERSSVFPVIFDGPKDFTIQGRHLLAFPHKLLCLSFICPEESSAWLLIKIWAALHFPFPFFFIFYPRRKF